ncbi:MAG: dephospho-CoA kinase [Flavobacteriales bacterium]|nr:MAG: dephospho-CoA kinase [Flavobacteriales bacterium]
MLKEEGLQNTEPEPEPKIIGLTGGIGSGKTTVAKFIKELGFAVYNSDVRAKNIVNDNPILKAKIIQLLGEEAYQGGVYNTKFVAEKVFENDELLQQLNQIIHPAVKQDFENWVSQQSGKFVFKETALLFELKLHEQCYQSILVTANDKMRIKRVMDRDDKTYREVEMIVNAQMPEKDKMNLADFVIENNADVEALKLATQELMKKFI